MKLESSELLFSDRLAPLTTSMGFIEANLENVIERVSNWKREIALTWDPKSQIDIVKVQDDIEETFKRILPFQRIHGNRFLFIPTKGNWIAYVDNNFRGTDPSAISYLAKLIGCRTLWMVVKPHTLQQTGVPKIGRQGALIIELYGPEEWPKQIRTIRLENNAGKWEFNESGEPLSFENVNQYKASKVTERFSFDTISQILHNLGIDAFSPDYYLPPNADTAYMIRIGWGQSRLINNVNFKRARRLNHIEEGLRIFGRLISREGYF